MSSRNVDAVRRWIMLGASGKDVDASVAELWDAGADYYPVRKWPEARPCHGREEVARFVREFAEPFSSLVWAIRWIVEIADDRVLACGNLRTEGRGSGINLEGDVYHCFWLRHGRFFRVEDHLTVSGALHALGLEEETLEDAGLRLEDAAALDQP